MTPNGATVPFRGIHLVRKQLFPYFGSYSPVHNLPTMPAVFTYFINAPCDDCALYSVMGLPTRVRRDDTTRLRDVNAVRRRGGRNDVQTNRTRLIGCNSPLNTEFDVTRKWR